MKEQRRDETRRFHSCQKPVTYYFGSCKDDWQAEGRDDDARREEDGELFAGVAGRVGVVDHSPRDAVGDGGEDVEEEQEQRPVFAAGSRRARETGGMNTHMLR